MLRKTEDDVELPEPAASAELDEPTVLEEPMLQMNAYADTVPPVQDRVDIEDSGLRISISVERREGRPWLTLAVCRAQTGEPVQDLELRVQNDEGTQADARTSAKGRATLACPPGRSVLRLGGSQAVSLDLQGLF